MWGPEKSMSLFGSLNGRCPCQLKRRSRLRASVSKNKNELSGFPQPNFYIGGKRFWDLEALEQWERTLSREPPGWLLTVEKGKPFGKQVDGQDKKIED